MRANLSAETNQAAVGLQVLVVPARALALVGTLFLPSVGSLGNTFQSTGDGERLGVDLQAAAALQALLDLWDSAQPAMP